jgi:hypothetical protein
MRVRWADLQPESTQQTEIFWQDFDYVKISETIDIQRMTTYIQMYLVAEFFDDTPMRVETLDVLMANMTLCKNVPGFRACETVLRRTPKGSPLRSVMLLRYLNAIHRQTSLPMPRNIQKSFWKRWLLYSSSSVTLLPAARRLLKSLLLRFEHNCLTNEPTLSLKQPTFGRLKILSGVLPGLLVPRGPVRFIEIYDVSQSRNAFNQASSSFLDVHK